MAPHARKGGRRPGAGRKRKKYSRRRLTFKQLKKYGPAKTDGRKKNTNGAVKRKRKLVKRKAEELQDVLGATSLNEAFAICCKSKLLNCSVRGVQQLLPEGHQDSAATVRKQWLKQEKENVDPEQLFLQGRKQGLTNNGMQVMKRVDKSGVLSKINSNSMARETMRALTAAKQDGTEDAMFQFGVCDSLEFNRLTWSAANAPNIARSYGQQVVSVAGWVDLLRIIGEKQSGKDYGHVMAIKIASDKRSDSTCILTLRDLRSRGADSCITIAVVTMEKEDFEHFSALFITPVNSVMNQINQMRRDGGYHLKDGTFVKVYWLLTPDMGGLYNWLGDPNCTVQSLEPLPFSPESKLELQKSEAYYSLTCHSLLLAHVSKTGATSWKVYQRTDLETLEDLQVAYMTSIAHMKLLNPVLKDMALPADLQLSALCEQLQSQWSGGSRPVLPADALKSIKPAQFDVSAPWLKVARNHKFGRDLSMSVLEGLKSDEIGMCDLHGNKQLTLKNSTEVWKEMDQMGAQGRKGWQASEAYLQQWYADSGQLQPSWAQVGFKPAKRAGWPQLNGYQQRLVSALEQVCGAKIEVSKPKAGQNLDLNIRGLSHDEYERVNMKLPEILPHIGYLPEQQVMLSGVLHTRLEVWLMMLERQNEVFQLLRTDDKTPQQCVQQAQLGREVFWLQCQLWGESSTTHYGKAYGAFLADFEPPCASDIIQAVDPDAVAAGEKYCQLYFGDDHSSAEHPSWRLCGVHNGNQEIEEGRHRLEKRLKGNGKLDGGFDTKNFTTIFVQQLKDAAAIINCNSSGTAPKQDRAITAEENEVLKEIQIATATAVADGKGAGDIITVAGIHLQLKRPRRQGQALSAHPFTHSESLAIYDEMEKRQDTPQERPQQLTDTKFQGVRPRQGWVNARFDTLRHPRKREKTLGPQSFALPTPPLPPGSSEEEFMVATDAAPMPMSSAGAKCRAKIHVPVGSAGTYLGSRNNRMYSADGKYIKEEKKCRKVRWE